MGRRGGVGLMGLGVGGAGGGDGDVCMQEGAVAMHGCGVGAAARAVCTLRGDALLAGWCDAPPRSSLPAARTSAPARHTPSSASGACP